MRCLVERAIAACCRRLLPALPAAPSCCLLGQVQHEGDRVSKMHKSASTPLGFELRELRTARSPWQTRSGLGPAFICVALQRYFLMMHANLKATWDLPAN